MAEALDEEQGIKMEVYSDLPGLQFYTGNTMKSTKGKGGSDLWKRMWILHGTTLFPKQY